MTATFAVNPVIYPNPVAGSGPFHIRVPLKSQGNIKVEIFTIAFRCVRTDNFSQMPVGEDVLVPVQDNSGVDLADGVYYVRVTTAQGNKLVKLLILR
jgi:hypothetical protein